MNSTIQHQLNHRTKRFFEKRAVPEETLEMFLDVINRTASSNGLQLASCLRITDPQQKAKISQVCQQAYVTDCPELFIFIVDVYKAKRILQAKGAETIHCHNWDQFFKGAADAYLMAQNLTNAVESCDMGAVYLGSILNDSQAIIGLLELPELTFPLIGVGFGYPMDQPELKPRMPMELRLSENTYQVEEDYLELLKDYDQEMTHYYDTRQKNQRSDTYTNQVVQQLTQTHPRRDKILQIAKKQGFQE